VSKAEKAGYFCLLEKEVKHTLKKKMRLLFWDPSKIIIIKIAIIQQWYNNNNTHEPTKKVAKYETTIDKT